METLLAHIRGAKVLNTYDFVDVIHKEAGIGWQVKSTKEKTPVTWKRAKLPNVQDMILESQESEYARQALGNAIINFSNSHVRQSFLKYDLKQIGYSRLIFHEGGKVTYFERMLCSADNPDIFDPSEFKWEWSEPKKTKTKEQLPALQGIRASTDEKWWAWHGLGENQLHFSMESEWWPEPGAENSFSFNLPTDQKISFEQLAKLLKIS